MRLIDISPPIHPQLGVWPGDVPFRRDVHLDFARGDHLTLSSIEASLHLGAHADAPSHYQAEGNTIEQCPLEHYYGDCQVIAVELPPATRIRPQDLQQEVRARRVLLRTGSFPDPDRWNEDFCALSAELVDFLAAAGVVLVGIDTPSVDLQEDRQLEAHSALARHGMANLEGLQMAEVDPGSYLLSAFPLRLVGADASPLRAVLVAE